MTSSNLKFSAQGFLYDPKKEAVFLHLRDLKTKHSPGKWGFFGGLGEIGETPVMAFIRELYEEINLKISPEKVKTLRSYPNEVAKTMRYVFFVESGVDVSDLKLGEGAGFKWIPTSKVFEYDLTQKTRDDLIFFLENRDKLSTRSIK